MKKLLILLGFAVLVSSLSGTSQLAFAEKWLASGEITEIFDDEGLLDGVLAVGDTWSQEIEINPAAADSEPADFLGIYRYDNTHVSFGDGVTYGNLPPLDEFDDICFVFNDDGVDAKGTQDSSLQQLSGPTLPSDLVFFSWVIADEDETVYDSDALPLGETDISEFEFTDMSFFAFPDGNNGITSLSTLEIGKPLSSDDLLEINQDGFVFMQGDVKSLIMIDEVGGEIIPIDTTALLLAGLQTSAIWMLPVLVGAAGAGAYYIKTRLNKDN